MKTKRYEPVVFIITVLLFTVCCSAGSPENQLVPELIKIKADIDQVLKSIIEDVQISVETDSVEYSYKTRKFTVHSIKMTGEISEDTYQEQGPSHLGFQIRISYETGTYHGQAEVPQDIKRPYWTTFINAYPVNKGKDHVYISLSFGSATDQALLRQIKSCMPHTSIHLYETVAGAFRAIEDIENKMKVSSYSYLGSLSNEELSKVYARAIAPQKISYTDESFHAGALEKVNQDRKTVLDYLFKSNSIWLNDHDREKFAESTDRIISELTALGPEAVEPIIYQLNLYGGQIRFRKSQIAHKAVFAMGSKAIERLIGLMKADDSLQRETVANLLQALAEPRCVDAFIGGLKDESGQVRRSCLQGLLTLGPESVGRDRLNKILIKCLEDHYHMVMYSAIQGLQKHGDQRAVEPLKLIETYHPPTGKGDIRYDAREAINAILNRMGQETSPISRSDYDHKPFSYDKLCQAAMCPNAGLRRYAVVRLGLYKNSKCKEFLVERTKKETDPKVLDEINRTLNSIAVHQKDKTS